MRENVRDTRELILETAEKLFYEKGYDSTSVRELSSATGLSVAGIYYFFADKEELLYTVLNRTIAGLNDSMRNGNTACSDVSQKIRNTIRNLLLYSIRKDRELNVLNREAMRLTEEHRTQINMTRGIGREELTRELIAYTEQQQLTDADIRYASFVIFSQTAWFTRWFSIRDEKELDRFAGRIFEMMDGALRLTSAGSQRCEREAAADTDIL